MGIVRLWSSYKLNCLLLGIVVIIVDCCLKWLFELFESVVFRQASLLYKGGAVQFSLELFRNSYIKLIRIICKSV